MAITAISKKTSKTKAIDRPVEPAVMKRAIAIAERYQVVMRREEDGWFGRGLELPGAMGDGATPTKCAQSIKDSMAAGIAYMIEEDLPIPPAALDAIKPVQLNFRVSADEKLRYEEAARQRGQSLSEFIRSAASAAA